MFGGFFQVLFNICLFMLVVDASVMVLNICIVMCELMAVPNAG